MKVLIALIALVSFSLKADDPFSDLSNYRQYSETLASAGQPNSQHLKALADQGVERIIYLAYTNNDTAIVSEDTKALDLGMEYIHIPVDYRNPTLSDFQYMNAILQTSPDKNTLIHCQINYRASVFSFLYRVVSLGTPVEEALNDMKSVWTPSGIWVDYIHSVAAHYDIDLNCDGCDWSGD